MSSKKFDLSELRFERDELLNELKELREGIDLDYFDFSLGEKKELYIILNKHISFIEGAGNKLDEIVTELNNNKLNKEEINELEIRALKLFDFFLDEITERKKKLDDDLNKYFTLGS